MLFKNIAALVAQGISLDLQIVGVANNRLEVTVIPKTESGKTGVSLVPVPFTGTPEEFDNEFANLIGNFGAKTLALKDQLADIDRLVQATAENAKAAALAAEKATKKPRSSAVNDGSSTPQLISGGEDEGPGSNGSAVDTVDPVPFTL